MARLDRLRIQLPITSPESREDRFFQEQQNSRIFRGRPRVIRWCGRPRSITSGRSSKPWKSNRLGAGIHDPNLRTSMTQGGAKNFGWKNLCSLLLPGHGCICEVNDCYRALSSTQLKAGNVLGAFLQTPNWINYLVPWVHDFYPVSGWGWHAHSESACQHGLPSNASVDRFNSEKRPSFSLLEAWVRQKLRCLPHFCRPQLFSLGLFGQEVTSVPQAWAQSLRGLVHPSLEPLRVSLTKPLGRIQPDLQKSRTLGCALAHFQRRVFHGSTASFSLNLHPNHCSDLSLEKWPHHTLARTW